MKNFFKNPIIVVIGIVFVIIIIALFIQWQTNRLDAQDLQ